jgi:hypothetical protein
MVRHISPSTDCPDVFLVNSHPLTSWMGPSLFNLNVIEDLVLVGSKVGVGLTSIVRFQNWV